VIRIPAEDVASQFTLIDYDLFKKIDLDELTGCGWIKKNKNQISPNVVAYTRRFNHVRSNLNTHFMKLFEIHLFIFDGIIESIYVFTGQLLGNRRNIEPRCV